MRLRKTTYLTCKEGPYLLIYIKKAGRIFNKTAKLLSKSNAGVIKLNARAVDDLIKIKIESHLIQSDLLWHYFQKTPEEIGFKKTTYCQRLKQLHKLRAKHAGAAQ